MANVFSNQTTRNLTANALTTVLSSPSAGSVATVIGCSIANTGSAPISADLALVSTSPASTTYLVRQATVPVGGSLVAIGTEQKVVVLPGQTLAVQPSSGNTDVVVSVLTIS